ncbi:MAG: polysaccharide biosynthesis C-terminal domain-containing protein [Bacteroidota bacterium]|nr:polysaccharide biosynthesis C-terminal domain-containing protein [Bacteroidota bacterium]
MGIVKRQGIKNTIIIYIGIIIGFISLLIIQPMYLSKTEIGLTRLLLAFASLFSSIFAFSISNITVKFFPYFKDYNNKHNGFFGLTVIIPTIGSALGCILLLFFKDPIIKYYSSESQVFISYFYHTFFFSFILSLIFALNSYCNALLKTTVPSFLNDIVTRLIFVLLILLYAFGFVSYQQFILLFILSYGLQASFLIGYIIYYGNPSFKISKSVIKQIGSTNLVKYGAVLTITTITSIGLKFLDMIMIGHYKSDADVGVYSIAVFIATIIETPLTSLERIANPKIAHGLAANNHGEVKDIYYQSSKYLTILGGLLTILVALNIEDLLLLLPNDYSGGIKVTILISIGAFINMATGINYPILFNSNKYYYGAVFIAIMLTTSFVLNTILIPVYGILGAAIATTIASIVFNILKYLFILKEFKMQPFRKSFFKTILVIGICLGIGILIPKTDNHIMNILLNGSVVTFCFLTLTFFFNIVPEFHKHIPFIKSK